jgi:hypothetical protein
VKDVGKLIVELPDEIHGELKKRAAVDHKTLKNIVTELIHEYLYTPEKHVSTTKKKTGLCGSWDDKRTAEEIIKDIKTRRKWFIGRKN